jgi:hypothetical protein
MPFGETNRNRRFAPDFDSDDEAERQRRDDLLALGGQLDEQGNVTLGGYVVHGPGLGGIDSKPKTSIDTEPKDLYKTNEPTGYETEEQIRLKKGKTRAA